MKSSILSIILLITWQSAFSQMTRQQSIDEAELGWYKVYHFKGAKESRKLGQYVFSVAQISIADSLANWMQASYLPKGGIGDIKRQIFPAADQYSPYKAVWPQGSGATAYTWSVAYNAQGKLERIPETEVPWSVNANDVPGWPIYDLSTASQYYFTMPSFESLEVGMDEQRKEQDLSNVPNLKRYITFWVRHLEGGGGSEYVLLCKDNKSPFIKITKGEYLREIEKGILRAYDEEKKSIHEKNAGNQKSIDYFMQYLEEKHAKRLACLKNNQEKYKNRLNELAETFTAQPDIKLENFADVFEGNGTGSPGMPVYKLDPIMVELCKKEKPQWILMSWYWHPLSPKLKHMHESIINNFNLDYVYNFFFDPEKVKGKPYQPLRSPMMKEVVVSNEKSDKSKKAGLDAKVHFFEDFSATPPGKKPIGWFAKASGTGAGCVVTTVDGVPDQWVQLAGTTLVPNNLKKPFPQNFTLEYDVMVPENFTWGAKGLAMVIARENSAEVKDAFIDLRVRPGWGGRNGEVTLETKFPEGYANGTKWYVANGFSNDKKVNRIRVGVKKTGEMLQVFIDKEKIVEYLKGAPGDLAFNALSFQMVNSDNDNDKYYVSNIRITRD